MASDTTPDADSFSRSAINDNADQASNGSDSPEIPETARWEWLLIAVICVFCMGYWAAHYHRYYEPNPDYYSFEQTARTIWSGRMPSDYWRMPIYPALFGALAQILPAEDPYINSALILNILFSAAGLALLFLLLRGVAGRVAIVVVGFSAFSMMLHDNAQKPLLEPFMLCMILLTLWLFRRGSRWQYVAAFFAAMTRYEAASLLFILFLLNSFSLRGDWFGSINRGRCSALVKLEWGGTKPVLKRLLFAALASTGFLIWMAGSLRQGNPHVDIMGEWGWPTNPQVVIMAASEPFYLWTEKARDGGYVLALFALMIGLPCLIGLLASFRKFGRTSAAILLLVFFTLVIQGIFGVFHRRYVYHIYWVPPLYFAVGWATMLAWADRKILRGKRRGMAVLAAGVISALVFCAIFWDSFDKARKAEGTALRPLYIETDLSDGNTFRMLTPDDAGVSADYIYPIFWFVMVGAFFAYGFLWGGQKGNRGVIIGCFIGALLSYYGASEILRHGDISWRRFYRYYDFVLVGTYLDENLNPGERAAVLDTGVILRMADLPEDAVFRFSKLKAKDFDELVSELKWRNINYIAYTWRGTDDIEERPEKRRIHELRQYDLMLELIRNADDMEEFELQAVLKFPERKEGISPRIYRFVSPKDPAGIE